jgi:hypothetical protein
VTQGDVGVANLSRESWGKEAGANVMSHVMLKHKPIATQYLAKDFSLAANKESKPAGLFMRDKGVFMNFLPPPRSSSLFHSLGRFLSRERQESLWRPRALDLDDHTNLLSHISIHFNTSGEEGSLLTIKK